MKTTTIRIDDDLMELIEKVADLKSQSSSEIMRAGIREYIGVLAATDERVRETRDEIAQRRITAQTNTVRYKLGMEPLEQTLHEAD